MGSVRFAVVLLLLCACSDDAQPPPIQDPDGGKVAPDTGITPPTPCSTPAPGCPCAEAGAQASCGTIYRKSGSYVTCAPGHYTCQGDAGWSSCEGPTVFDGH